MNRVRVEHNVHVGTDSHGENPGQAKRRRFQSTPVAGEQS